MVEVNVKSESLRGFAGAGTGYNDAALQNLVNTPTCSNSELEGCIYFRNADGVAAQGVMRAVTGAEYLLNGVRHGASKMADLYEGTDQAVAATQQKVHYLNQVAPEETGLPPVNRRLETAVELGAAS